jgi:PAS domain S-box-containing protein
MSTTSRLRRPFDRFHFIDASLGARDYIRGVVPGHETELRFLVDGIPEAIARMTPDGIFTYVSAGAERLFGRPAADLVGIGALELVDPVDRPEAQRRLEALAAAGEGATDRITLRVTHPGGGAVWVDSSARVLTDPESGEPIIVAVAREADDRVEAQRALARIEDRFREMVELLPVVVYESDPGPEGRFQYVSPQIEDLLGYTPTEWMADPGLWARSLHPDDRDWVIELEQRQQAAAAGSERRIGGQYRMIHRGGHTVTVSDAARLCDSDTGAPFWRGVLIDVGAEEAAQRTLAEAQTQFQEMVDGLPACVYRAEARHVGRWEFVSSQVESLLGYRPDELTADPTLWRASLHRDDREWVIGEEERLAEMPPGTENVLEYRLRSRLGHTVWVRDRSVLTKAPDGRLMIEGILTDISAERAAQPTADGPADVYRLVCNDCGHAWAAERVSQCTACSSVNVEGTSLNATLGDLAASRRQVEGLLDGIHRHLETLGANLRSASTALAIEAEEAGRPGDRAP